MQAAPTNPVRINMLGGLSVVFAARTVAQFATQRVGLLLGYLATYPRRPHTREELTTLLWPDSEPRKARSNLRFTLSTLRSALEIGADDDALLQADRHTICLVQSAFLTDVALFHSALERASAAPVGDRLRLLMAADQLYTGRYLPAFYEDWVNNERNRYEELYTGALEQIMLLAEEHGELGTALDYAYRLKTLDAESEVADECLARIQRARQTASGVWRIPSAGPDHGAKSEGASPVQGDMSADQAQLALPLSRFFGHDEDIERVCDMFMRDERRLVTLTGPGGCGKTRLAIEALRTFSARKLGRTWFVTLVGASDAASALAAIGDVLKIDRPDAADSLERIAAALQGGRALVALDNFEHLIEREAEGGAAVPDTRCKALVAALLQRVPGLAILATSQIRLNVPGEQIYPVGLLSVPEPDGAAGSAGACASVRMFVDRVRLHRPDFELRPQALPMVAEICRRLAGYPLAIELAAAWADSLALPDMLMRLASSLDVPPSDRQGVPARHRSLTAALDSSFALLDPASRRLFARLCVFHGGWTAAAVRQVFPEDAPTEGDAIRALSLLAGRSLIETYEAPTGMRYRFLQPLRDYASEKPLEMEVDELRRRHVAYVAAMTREAEEGLKGAQQGWWLARIADAHENITAALKFALRLDPETGLRISSNIWRYWFTRGPAQEGRRWMEAFLAAPQEYPPMLLGTSLNRVGILTSACGALEPAGSYHRRALEMFERTESGEGICSALNNLGRVAQMREDLDAAERFYSRSRDIALEHGYRQFASHATTNLGAIAMRRRDYAAAERILGEALSRLQAENDDFGLASALHNLAESCAALGNAETAARHCRRAIEVRLSLGERRIAGTLDIAASILSSAGRHTEATRLLGATAAAAAATTAARPTDTAAETGRAMRAALRDEAYEAALREGAALSLEEAAQLALRWL